MNEDRIEGMLSDAEFLQDLGDRILKIPVMHGVDEYDRDELYDIARRVSVLQEAIRAMLASFDMLHVATEELAETSSIKKARLALRNTTKG